MKDKWKFLIFLILFVILTVAAFLFALQDKMFWIHYTLLIIVDVMLYGLTGFLFWIDSKWWY